MLEALPYVGSLAATDSTDGLVPLGALPLSTGCWAVAGRRRGGAGVVWVETQRLATLGRGHRAAVCLR